MLFTLAAIIVLIRRRAWCTLGDPYVVVAGTCGVLLHLSLVFAVQKIFALMQGETIEAYGDISHLIGWITTLPFVFVWWTPLMNNLRAWCEGGKREDMNVASAQQDRIAIGSTFALFCFVFVITALAVAGILG